MQSDRQICKSRDGDGDTDCDRTQRQRQGPRDKQREQRDTQRRSDISSPDTATRAAYYLRHNGKDCEADPKQRSDTAKLSGKAKLRIKAAKQSKWTEVTWRQDEATRRSDAMRSQAARISGETKRRSEAA